MGKDETPFLNGLKRGERSLTDLQVEIEKLNPTSREPLKGKHIRTKAILSLIESDHSDAGAVLSEKMIGCAKRWGRELTKVQYQREALKLPIETPLTYMGKYNRWLETKFLKSGKNCQSLWCKQCRLAASKHYEGRVWKRLNEKLIGNPYTNTDLKHITGVVGVCNFDINELEKLLRDDNLRWRRMRRRFLQNLPISKSPFIECVYEFELVDWDNLKSSQSDKSPFKKKQMEQLIDWYRPSSNLILFVHFHGITNLNPSELFGVVRDEYWVDGKPLIKTHSDVGWFVQSLHIDKPFDENIKKIASYCFKSPHRYKHSFIGSDYQNGEYIPQTHLSKLILIYQQIQKRSWRGLFRSISNPISEDIAQYRDRYPHIIENKNGTTSTHPIWTQYLSKVCPNGVVIVDTDGISYPEGWNPNLILDKDNSFYGFELKYEEVVGREHFPHPKFPYLMIYKNVWKEVENPTHSTLLDNTFNFDQFYKFEKKKKIERKMRKTKKGEGYRYTLIDPSKMWRGLDGFTISSLILRGLDPPLSETQLFSPSLKDQTQNIPFDSKGAIHFLQRVRWIEEVSNFISKLEDKRDISDPTQHQRLTSKIRRLKDRIGLRQRELEENGIILTVV